jgi:capsular exopolysaccharide synthesis family protein
MPPADTLRMLEARSAVPLGRPVDLKRIFGAFGRRWQLFTAVVLGAVTLAVAASLILRPVYDATAVVRVDPVQKQAIDIQALSTGAPPDQALVDSEVRVMQSRDVARAVVSELKLVDDPEFHRGKKGDPEEVAIDSLLRNLSVTRQGSTYLVAIRFKSSNAAKAVNIANAIARQYILSSVRVRSQTAAEQADWLAKRLDAASTQAQAADAELARYKASKGLVTAASGGTITEQQITTLTLQLATAESDAAAARSNYDAARSQMGQGGVESVSSVLNSATITELRRQRAELQRARGEIDSRYGPRHPETLKIEQQIQGIDKQIQDESRRIVAGLETDARAAAARAAALRRDLAALTGNLASNSEAAVRADSLQRDAEAKRGIFNQLANSAQQANQEEANRIAQARIQALATLATKPFFPNKPLFALLGFVLGLVLGSTAVFLAEMLDGGVRTVEEVEQDLGANFIASAPMLTPKVLAGADPWDYVINKPMSGFAESLRSARSAITLATLDGPRKIIAITSALPGEGKTVSSVSLARIMAMSSERVLLVDCDLRRNALAGLFAQPPEHGMLEVLTGACTLEQAIIPDRVPGLDILPLRKADFTPRDLFGTRAMTELLETMRGRYDHVVLDCPPLLAVNDARIVASMSDVVLFVARWGKTPRKAIQMALSYLTVDRAPLAGLILSMVDTRARLSIGTGDPTYYYGAYQGYYHD